MFGLSDNQNDNLDASQAGATSSAAPSAPFTMDGPAGAAVTAPLLSSAPVNAFSPTPAPPMPAPPPPLSVPAPPMPPVGGPSSSVSDPLPPTEPPASLKTATPGQPKEEPKAAPKPPQDPQSNPLPPASSLLGTGADDQLIKMKQDALHSLAPLIDHLDQTPEEKFKTTMMMIQAADNKDLIKEAFEAANKIKDDKARAQALLDVVNEINYFTHKESENAPPAS